MTGTHETETFRRAFDVALANLIVPPEGSRRLSRHRQRPCLIGTLTDIDERFGDFKAAMRLFISSLRSAP